jgi:transposase-like protein
VSQPHCPGCSSANVEKTGHPDKLGLDIYRCVDCDSRFTVEVGKEQRRTKPPSIRSSGSAA